jgi:hypothetical protein
MASIFAIIKRDGAKCSTGSRCSAFRQLAPSSCEKLRIFFAIVRMVSTMAIKYPTILAAHGAIKSSSAVLWQSVLVM